jgi:hypothetical protein
LILFLSLVAQIDAAAKHPADVFGSQIVVADKKMPTSAASSSKYIKILKKMRVRRILQDKESKRWTIYFAAFFRQPLKDLEVTIRLYDVTEGQKKMVTSFEQYLGRKGERSFHSQLALDDKQIPVNRHVLMEVVNKGRILAATEFDLIGEAEKYSGQVDFSSG